MKSNYWENFLNPQTLKGNLIKTSMFITAFELLKDRVIDHPKTLFCDDLDSEGWIINENYQIKVLSRNKSPLYASLDWFEEMETISEEDIEIFNKLKDYRNKLTHEMADIISQGINEEEYYKLFSDLINFFEKIDKWWILNFELAIDPDIEIEHVDENSVQSGPVLMLKVMLDIVFSDEEESWKYYNDFVKTFVNR
ncbi:hypothetical protein [Paenibacillus sp. ISL-20]|uniref:HEPN domain-containing protein n=1 Tax=Paenibacillus sp. ISL-20 TaxID=2819163 RepID=UPI001BEC7E1E|nr:hypothetical protein [Paenibacillus sp. ISL-20]MBT2764049.1 hypothetical protein [Paenibacillus sp. ISL-20]